jgi:hypothetical protein
VQDVPYSIHDHEWIEIGNNASFSVSVELDWNSILINLCEQSTLTRLENQISHDSSDFLYKNLMVL